MGQIGLIWGFLIDTTIFELVSLLIKTSKYIDFKEQAKDKLESTFKNIEENLFKDFETFI